MSIAYLLFVPAIASAFAFIIITFDRTHVSPKKPHNILLAYLLATGITWFTFFQCYFYPGGYLYTHTFAMLAFLMVPVFLYQLIFEATKLEATDRFSYIHYFVPVLISMTLLVTTFLTPKSAQLQCITTLGRHESGQYGLFCWLVTNRMPMRLVLSLLYTVMGFQRLHAYRRAVLNYSASDTTSRLSWVFWLLCALASLILIPFLGLHLTRKELFLSPWMYVQGGVLTVMNAYLCVYVMRWQSIVYKLEVIQEKEMKVLKGVVDTEALPQEGALERPNALTKRRVERYMAKHKPYLDPNLRIADLAAGLGVNRTHVSAFINETYQMNFSRFINNYRYEAYQELAQNQENAMLKKTALAEMAGFNSYRSFLRFKELREAEGLQ